MTEASRHRKDHRHSLAEILKATDTALRRGRPPGSTVWATGFDELDAVLDGGVRAGELILIGGNEGAGKTTFGVQVLRNVATAGGTVLVFSFEHVAHTLVQRLLALESAEVAIKGGHVLNDAADVPMVRSVFETGTPNRSGLEAAIGNLPFGFQALTALQAYADRLHIHESDARTSPEEISAVILDVTREHGVAPVVLVDYLQKVPLVDVDLDATERITVVAERLKDIALELGCPVLSIVASNSESLEAGHRIRAHDFRGSSALAYEADVILVLASKEHIVAREHLVYDLANTERFRGWAIMTIEKNRHGVGKVEFEMQKDFAHGRFDPHGQPLHERLIEGRVFTA